MQNNIKLTFDMEQDNIIRKESIDYPSLKRRSGSS